MTTCEHLVNAPITEALIDIRTTLPEATSAATLESICEKVGAAYPTRREIRHHAAQFSIGAQPSTSVAVKDDQIGCMLHSKDGKQVLQARLDGFTFSRLRPYLNWEQLRDEAKTLWSEYCAVAQPESVTRIAVRYINRIELPLPVNNLKEWLLTGPEIAENLPQNLGGYFFRVHLPFAKPEAEVFIIQHVDVGSDASHVPVILDIDAFLLRKFDPTADDLWQCLEDLRTVKNKVFFESITDRTKELFR